MGRMDQSLMSTHRKGKVIVIAALGSLLGLLAIEIANINTWSEVFTPSFIAAFMGHIAATIAAFIGGNLMDTTDSINNLMGEKK